jgi:diketogulonate reductase-like aldo/keto reductase
LAQKRYIATMIRKRFGWTGVEIPVIGQGTWMIDGSRQQERAAIEALRLGLELGLTHVDTAEMYGNGRAEELVAEAIAGCRHEVFLASKVLPSNASYKGTIQACDRSLKRLRTDWLDLYMLHWPGTYPLEETMGAMEALVDAGKVRFIGVSNFDVNELKAAENALNKYKLACNQVLYHLGNRGIERRLVPYCASRGIAIVGYSPFGHGRFPSPESPGGQLLAEVGRKHRRTPRQVALNFLTRFPHVFTIPKHAQHEHVRENSGGAGWHLDEEDLQRIDATFPLPAPNAPLGML